MFRDRATAQAVIRRRLTADARFRARASPCGMRGMNEGALGQGFK
jgi:hypothetical protein